MSPRLPFSVSVLIDRIVFGALLLLIALTAIPYGSVEPWWRAAFQCGTFILAALAIVERLLLNARLAINWRLFTPLLALIAFALLQTVSFPTPISADPFQTRQFALHLVALMLLGWLVMTRACGKQRVLWLVDAVIATGCLSACFGLVRQASQRSPGFVLPHLMPGYGYAQFINSNHFALLMTMALGLSLGVVICRGVSRKRLVLYLLAAVPMWVALILSNSRGGILSMLCQVVFLGKLFLDRKSEHGGILRAHQGIMTTVRRVVIPIVLVGVMLAGAIVTVVFVGGDPLVGRVEQVQAELNIATATSYTLRQSIWRATWKMIKAHPVAGVGFGGYWMAITQYHQGSGEATPQEAHNDYLELLASGGLIGLAITIWFAVVMIGALRRGLQQNDERNGYLTARAVKLGALAGIVAVAIHSLVDFGLHIPINAAVFTVLLSLMARGKAQRAKS